MKEKTYREREGAAKKGMQNGRGNQRKGRQKGVRKLDISRRAERGRDRKEDRGGGGVDQQKQTGLTQDEALEWRGS
jgi:hypothetical protein